MAALPIILNILKVTGIVLASILGLVILILLLVLFVPVRYKLSFVRTGEEGDEPIEARGYASWLLHILHVSLAYPAESVVTIRIFGIPIRHRSADEEKEKNKETRKKAKEETEKIEGHKFGDNKESGDSGDNPSSEEDEFLSHDEDDDEDVASFDSDEAASEDDPHKTIFSRISDQIHKIQYTISDFCAKIKKIADDLCDKTISTRDKLESISKDIHYYHKILTSELFERTFEKCKRRVIKLLKSVLPRKGDIRLEVGFDDPYTTGEVLAVSSILYPLTGRFLHVYGNFEEAVIRGGGYLKGRIYIFTLAKLFIFYLVDQDLKKTIKLFKKEPINKKRKSGRRSDGGDQ